MHLLRRLFGRRPAALGEIRQVVAVARHPYQHEIDQHRGMIFIDCRAQGCTLNGRPISDGEFGPQMVDPLPDGVRPLAQDARYVYGDDGERYRCRPPR